jgi:pimeloyl-ACP methyl ester carboxylesterase
MSIATIETLDTSAAGQLVTKTASLQDTIVVTRDGTVLSVRDTGPRNAPHTVVLMHGLCLNKESWDIQAHALVTQWGSSVRVISYDHRGHGKSAQSEIGTYRTQTLARDLADVLDRLGVTGKVTLAGHSMGGMTALEYLSLPADQRPVEPGSLVLVATAAGRLSERGLGILLGSPAVNGLYHAVGHFPERVADAVIHRTSSPLLRVLTGPIGYGELRRTAYATLTAASIDETHLRTKIGFLMGLKSYDCYPTLPLITARTTVFSGGKDPLTPKSHAEDMASMIPGAQHIHQPDSGHMIQHEVPALVTNALSRGMAAEVA